MTKPSQSASSSASTPAFTSRARRTKRLSPQEWQDAMKEFEAYMAATSQPSSTTTRSGGSSSHRSLRPPTFSPMSSVTPTTSPLVTPTNIPSLSAPSSSTPSSSKRGQPGASGRSSTQSTTTDDQARRRKERERRDKHKFSKPSGSGSGKPKGSGQAFIDPSESVSSLFSLLSSAE